MFKIEGKEREKVEAWWKKHTEEDECRFMIDPFAGGAIGGVRTYSFTPTGLGVVIVVKCACGAEENCTDFDSW